MLDSFTREIEFQRRAAVLWSKGMTEDRPELLAASMRWEQMASAERWSKVRYGPIKPQVANPLPT